MREGIHDYEVMRTPEMAEGIGDDKASASTPSVFVSYATQDAAVAADLVGALERHGIACWIAPRDVKAGALYADAIVRAISGAKAFVLVLSNSSIASSHVSKEIERASSKKRPIIALRIDAAPLTPALEYFLSESQWVEAQAGKSNAAYSKLIAAVRELSSAAPETPVVGALGPLPGTTSPALPHSHRTRKPLAVGLALVVTLSAVMATRFWFAQQHSAVRSPASAATNVTSDKSIAVLPFKDLSEKHDQEYFADGMAEEILDLLGNIPGLKVISRTSSFQFKGKSQDLRTIGKALGVSYLVEGSVRKSTDRLRVTAQLINTQDGSHAWSDSYDEPVDDVLKVQDQVAMTLVRALQVSVGADNQAGRRSFASIEAYNLYLRGRHAVDRADKEGLESARAYFQQALDLEPTATPAVEWLAATNESLAEFSYVDPQVGFERARALAQRALALEPNSSGAHVVLARIHTIYDWDWRAADREAREAVRLKPRDSISLYTLATVSAALGNWDESARLLQEALAVNPLDADLHMGLANLQIVAGRLSDAEAEVRKVLQISPSYGEGHFGLAQVLMLKQDPGSALREMQLEQTDPTRYAGLAIVYHALGRKAESDAALASAVEVGAQGYASEIADACAYRGELDQGFAWLDNAYNQKDPGLYLVKLDPYLANLRKDPRYAAFLRKMNLPD